MARKLTNEYLRSLNRRHGRKRNADGTFESFAQQRARLASQRRRRGSKRRPATGTSETPAPPPFIPRKRPACVRHATIDLGAPVNPEEPEAFDNIDTLRQLFGNPAGKHVIVRIRPATGRPAMSCIVPDVSSGPKEAWQDFFAQFREVVFDHYVTGGRSAAHRASPDAVIFTIWDVYGPDA